MAGLSQSSVTYVAEYPRWRRLVGGRTPPPVWVIRLALLDVAVAANSLWLMRALAAVLLAVLPGQLLLRALRIPAKSVRRYVPYLACASIAVLIVTTLVVNLAGPVFGVHEPLRRLPLLVGLNIALPALALAGHRAPPSCDLKVTDLIGRSRWLWPLLLPVVAVAAATRLDNGDGNALAILVIVFVVVMIPVGTFMAHRLGRRQVNLLLYGSGLAMMLLTSMRSSHVIGFDISSEYYDFHQTVVNGIWHFGHLNPYEAMLSLTVLPASLHALIGGQDVWIFKFGYPVLFALFPVAVYSFARRFLSRRAAFVAACIVIVQYYFFEQQPEIARQEIGLLIFAGLMGVLFDTSLEQGPKLWFLSVLGVSLVLCHYSTTYIAIALCLLSAVGALTVGRRRSRPIAVVPWLVAGGVMTVATLIWYVPATYSTSNITAAAQSIRQTGFQLLPGRHKGESIFSAYFNGLRETATSPSQFQNSIAVYYAEHRTFIIPLPTADDPSYNLRAAPPLTDTDHASAIASLQSDAELLVQQTIDALAVIGALVFALRRRGDAVTRMVGVVGLVSFFMLAASRLSGALASDYNSSRLFLQCLFVLAPLEAALFEMVVTRLKSITWLGPALFGAFSLMLVVSFVGNTDLAAPVVGGGLSLSLSNNSEDYADLYPTAQEQASAQWLASSVPSHRVVYADYFGQLRLDQFTDLRSGVFIDITPQTIDQHAWVYATTSNVVDHRTWGVTNTGILDLEFPASFLDKYFDVVYSNGSSEVFHR